MPALPIPRARHNNIRPIRNYRVYADEGWARAAWRINNDIRMRDRWAPTTVGGALLFALVFHLWTYIKSVEFRQYYNVMTNIYANNIRLSPEIRFVGWCYMWIKNKLC